MQVDEERRDDEAKAGHQVGRGQRARSARRCARSSRHAPPPGLSRDSPQSRTRPSTPRISAAIHQDDAIDLGTLANAARDARRVDEESLARADERVALRRGDGVLEFGDFAQPLEGELVGDRLVEVVGVGARPRRRT